MLSQPLKLHCNAVVCAKCIADSIATLASTQCPCCEDAVNLVPGSVQPAPDLTQRLLCDVMVSCDTCNRDVRRVTMTHTSATGWELLKNSALLR